MIKPPLETIRISQQGKDQLLKLRRNTGIEHWNVLCRWAFCVSLQDQKPPTAFSDKLDGGVEMTWKVFAGEYTELYAGLIRQRARNDGWSGADEDLGQCFRAHLHRGLNFLSSGGSVRSVSDLCAKWIPSTAPTPV